MPTNLTIKGIHFGLLVLGSATLPFLLLAFSFSFGRAMPLNDVLLYGWWLQNMQPGEILGISAPFVYPYPSLAPMILANFLGGAAGILVGWCVLISFLNVLVVGFLTRWGRGGRSQFSAAWFWLAFLLLLGPVAIGRIDAISVTFAILGVVAFSRDRLVWAMTLFTLGAWIKIWPIALGISAFLASNKRLKMLVASLSTVVCVVGIALLLGANSNLFSFVFTQTGRGIQIEAPIATPWLWAAKFDLANAGIYFDDELITNQISGDLVSLVSSLMTPVMTFAFLITVWLGLRALKAGASRNEIFTWVAMTGVLDLIVFNKVGSPQFMAWIAVPTIALIYFKIQTTSFPLIAILAVALITNLVYPIFYLDLMSLGDFSVTLLTVRNLVLVCLLVWANRQLGKLGGASKVKLAERKVKTRAMT